MFRKLSPQLLALVLALGLAPAARAQDAQLPGGPAAFEGSLVKLAKHVRARTVLVYGLIGLGSGAVVTPEGKVVTNAHVVAGANYAILQWADGSHVLAKRAGVDYGRDLAVLEPERPLGKKVPAFTLAPARPKTGDWVMAGGFPGGLRTTSDPTISLGRVIGKNPAGAPGTQVMGMLDYAGAIRTDVPIFSGNSGGPLVDMQGRLVGINGAVDLVHAVSMTVPIELVQTRLRSLRGGVIVLPNGTRLDPTTNSILRRLFAMLDPTMRAMPKRIREMSKAAAAARRRLRGVSPGKSATPRESTTIASDRLADVARKSARQPLLRGAFPALGRALSGANGVDLTPIGGRFAVTVSSRIGGVERLELPGVGTARVVARSPADDLALLELPSAPAGVPADAPAHEVGSLVCVAGPQGKLAAGILSVGPRPTSSTVLSHIQQGTSGTTQTAVKAMERLAKMLSLKTIQQLLAQIRKSMEMKQAFAGGTTPHDLADVVSIDAPLPPSAVGAPVYDRAGKRIGVAVGVAHHGTSYVVPMSRIRTVFRAALRPRTGGAPRTAPAPKPAKPAPKPAAPPAGSRDF